jgi:branched-chain amino acid transport system permease protein
MILACRIGGIGTIEGPILGTIVFFALQQWLANYGTWYFIVLGAIAIAVAIWAPRGLWGLISERLNIRLFPVGYVLWPASGAVAGPDGGPAVGPAGVSGPPALHQLIRRLGRRS